jgi:hypothetical protein
VIVILTKFDINQLNQFTINRGWIIFKLANGTKVTIPLELTDQVPCPNTVKEV